MQKTIFALALLLLAASIFMYVTEQSGQAQLQTAPVTPQELKQAEAPDNPYVIRNGSNELPPGVKGEDPDKTWMPAWQKDRIKDMKGVPMVGTPQEMFGKSATANQPQEAETEAKAATTQSTASNETNSETTEDTLADLTGVGKTLPKGNVPSGPSTYIPD